MKYIREGQTSYDITYIWNLKYDTNELIYQTEIDSQTIENKFMATKRERGGEVKIRSLGLIDTNYYI